MKRFLSLLFFILVTAYGTANAQRLDPQNEKVQRRIMRFERLRSEYLKEKVPFTEEEIIIVSRELKLNDAQKMKLLIEQQTIYKEVSTSSSVSESQYGSYLKRLLAIDDELAKIQEELIKKLSKSLSSEKVCKTLVSLREFQTNLGEMVRKEAKLK